MPDLLLAAVGYGGYISIFKLLIFLILFFGWIPLLSWIFNDAKTIETNELTWTAVIMGAGTIGIIIWLVIPVFIIGMLVYLIAVGAPALAYVKHRNSLVLDFDKVLTVDHLKSVFESKDKKIAKLRKYTFITANKNEIPIPEPRTPEFFGFKTTYEIMSDALWRRASSIAFSPTPQDYNISYYVDGSVLNQPSLGKEQMKYLISFVKQLADLDTKEKRKPQKGKFRVAENENYTEWEVTTAGSTAGEQVRLKEISHEELPRLNELGLMPEQYEQLSRFNEIKQGVYIISGPAKSGLTTTLYAFLRNHDAFMNHISTLEKQASHNLPNITQSNFSLSDTGTTTFAKKLQTVMRTGPDIIGVGECEDPDTAKVACAAAADGKLIYVTLRADSVIQAFAKWLKFVGDRNLAVGTLLGISNQRLVRMLCSRCKQAYTPDKELFKKFNINAEKTKVLYRAGKVIYDKRGKPSTCDNCQGTGHFGRTGIFEMITLNNELRKILIQTRTLPEIAAQLRRAKMLYLQEQALRRVISGNVAINEMIRVLSAGRVKKEK
ncbi:MAG: Flp pilus assembly complex ATPase component TadA [Sedimentisphaerales bacterium]|nr:Flp pilus assembly complex ATPase component TadA [Sedimentisphaerales bacterium]